MDYLAQHDARLAVEGSATRLLVGDNNVLFENQTPETLRRIINDAVEFVSGYFADNLGRSKETVRICEHQIEQVSIRVVLRYLYMYNMWKNHNDDYRDHAVGLTQDDLRHPYTRDETLFYCEGEFPQNHQSVAASLLGTTRDEFAEWEASRRDFWNRR